MDKTEMRLDPLTEAWTLFSAARTVPPDFGPAEIADAVSPFTKGREALSPQTLHANQGADGWQVRVVPNRTPAVRIEGNAQPGGEGFYDRMDGVGAHEVIIEQPGPGPLEELPLNEIGKVLTAWKTRMLDLQKDSRLHSFTVLKEVGAPAGGRVPHSVSQLVALAIIPPRLRKKLEVAREFYARKGRSIFADILTEEFRVGTRLVYENNGCAVFCPYASRSPFEMAIYPKRQCADYHGLTDQECAQLADGLRNALGRLNRALNHPPYQLMLTTAPSRTARRDHWNTLDQDFRWHLEIVPRLHFPGALETATGCAVNSVWPETAAQVLRTTEVSR